ncbi:MAG: PHP domain-containing protein [Clostridia bacterium]|nr:PHP domain-containing protein [Clostridia bacterium]
MRKYLFSPENKFYKANMHCHTNISDGRKTPQEIKDEYVAKGYSIVAFTDHRVVVPHPELEDENFLPITASEFDCNDPDIPWPATRTYHLNFYSKDKNRAEFIPFTRVHSPEGINKVIADAKAAGFLAQYNHPRWSMQRTQDFLGLEGLDFFEIFNTGAELGEGFQGDAEYEYGLFCSEGKGCGITAGDDNHQPHEQFGGFTMISAPALEYGAVIKALEQGDCYASRGPIIKELYVEDGVLHIECSPVSRIAVLTETRAGRRVLSEDGSDCIESADIPLDLKHDFIRVTLVDSHGRRAWTRAYFGV